MTSALTNPGPGRAVPRASAVTRAGFVVWVPFWLSVGIGWWFGLRHEPGFGTYLIAGTVVVAAILACLLLRRLPLGPVLQERLFLAAVSAGLVAAGMLVVGARSHLVAAPVLEFRYYGPIEGRVAGIDRSARDRIRVTLDRVVLRNMAPDRVPKKVRLSLMNATDPPAPGEHVMLTGHLGPPPGPADPQGFDFRRMAWFEGLGAVGYTRTPILRAADPQQGGVMALHRLRMDLSQAIQQRIGGQAGAVSAALMTGDRSGIAEATNEVMRISSLYHIISISGLHMTMLAAFVYGTTRFLGVAAQGLALALLGRTAAPPLHKLAAAAALVAASGYLWLSGGGVATERAYIMVAVMLTAILFDRRAISLRTVAIAGLIVLVLTPEALVSPSFQMSFAATVVLVLMASPWQAAARHLPKWSHAVLLLLLTSVFAGLATGPIAAAHFGRISQYGLLANMLVVPVMGAAVMNMGVIALLLAPFGLEGLALWIMGMGARWMILVSEWIAGLRGADLLVPLPPPQVVPLIGAGMMLAALSRRRLVRIRGRPAPAPVFAAGGALLALALAAWLTDRRPDVLISAEGNAVGVMTAQGRAVSKPAGGAFAIGNWLADDGDSVPQAVSAGREAWHGPRNLRQAQIARGGTRLRLVHATGKFDQQALRRECLPRTIIVTDAPWTETGCLVLDLQVLRREGAVAIWLTAQGPRMVTTAQLSGLRRWSRTSHRPFRPLTGFAGNG